MFANQYIRKSNLTALLSCSANKSTGIIVVIPCLYEPEILKTLQSLIRCIMPACGVEVVVVINHSENAPETIKIFNGKTKEELDAWIRHNPKTGIRFFAAGPLELRKKWAGAGLARKKGMDEAIIRFNETGRNKGIIVSLDADTVVEPNYLLEIDKHFRNNTNDIAATISFCHQSENLEETQLRGIKLYEQYLAYYKQALDFTGYPFSMFTVGSAFAVSAEAYVKRGGMNRRQAGEDFYFLQNLAQIGTIGEISSTTVHPSARLSNRVPFGTGPILQKWMKGEEDLTQTYHLDAFIDLKTFFGHINEFYQLGEAEYTQVLNKLPRAVAAYLIHDYFWKDLKELNANCASESMFKKRFFQKFNAFRILKFLNFAHNGFYEKADLDEQCLKLEAGTNQ
ncbi:MAG: glycosyltransferase family 2 protein [Draconibacterium sp.]